MSNNKQSSVEWLVEQIKKDINLRLRGFDIDKALEQAKSMHKKEILKLYNDFQDYLDEEFKNQCGGQGNILTFEQYYNEKFGSNNEE